MTDAYTKLRTSFDSLVGGLKGPVPVAVLSNFLFGELDPASGMPSGSKIENPFFNSQEIVEAVLQIVQHNIERVENLPSYAQPILVCCGGGPGSGKSTTLFGELLNQYRAPDLTKSDWAEPGLLKVVQEIDARVPMAFAAADRKALSQLALSKHGAATATKEFYLAHRAASNFMAMAEFNAAFHHGKDIIWDTTLGSEGAVKNLQYAKDNGYIISALLQGAPLDIREAAVNARNEVFYQSLSPNVAEQEKGFRQVLFRVVRMADQTLLSWRNKPDEASEIVAQIFPKEKRAIIAGDAVEKFSQFLEMYPEVEIGNIEPRVRLGRLGARIAYTRLVA